MRASRKFLSSSDTEDMYGEYVIAPATQGDSGFVELARSRKGRLFRKQILKMGQGFVHPGNPNKRIEVTPELALSLQRNFRNKVCDIVQVPIVDGTNAHVEDPLRNIGEVVDLTYDDNGVYAVIDARKHAEELGNTLIGASALMHLDYADTTSGVKKGPTLLHVAVTNRPYITDLEDFEEIVAASADTSGEKPVVMVPANETEENMDLNEMLTVLRDEHGIDVQALQKQASANSGELITALSNVVAPERQEETLTIKDVADAVIELAEERVALSGQVASLEAMNEEMAQREAEEEVDRLIKQGRILPKQRSKMVHLSRSDRETFEALLPDDAIVSLSAEGVDTHDAPEQSQQMQENIERLANIANGL